MERIKKIDRLTRKWQAALKLNDWNLGARLVDFKRTDYPQSGDIEVDPKNKKATILFSNNPQKNDEYIVVHELVHLLLWEYDRFCENLVSKNQKDRYFNLLEDTAVKFTDILLRENSRCQKAYMANEN